MGQGLERTFWIVRGSFLDHKVGRPWSQTLVLPLPWLSFLIWKNEVHYGKSPGSGCYSIATNPFNSKENGRNKIPGTTGSQGMGLHIWGQPPVSLGVFS